MSLGVEDAVSSFAVRPVVMQEGVMEILVATKSLQLKYFSTADALKPIRSWKGHTMPVSCMVYDSSGTLCALGHTDGRVLVYDVAKGYITHSFAQHGGPVTSILFQRGAEVLISSSQDSTLMVWDLLANKGHKKLAGHLGAVSGFCLLAKDTLISAGRDRVLMGWSLKGASALFTLPIFESLETCCAIDNDIVVVGGVEGKLKVFSFSQKKVVYECSDLKFQVGNLLYDRAAQHIICTTSDHNIVVYQWIPQTLRLQRVKILIGDLDQIADVSLFGEHCERVAVATNSKDIKLWNSACNSWSLLCGHTDLVLSVDASVPSLLASGGKDCIVRVWQEGGEGEVFEERCALVGHTDSVNAVRLCETGAWLASVSKDRTLKVWPLERRDGVIQASPGGAPFTAIVHSGEVNCVAISPPNKGGGGHFVATGGADKKVALWWVEHMSARKQNVVSVCKLAGHKRGIWDVRFSPVAKLIATASGDGTVRVWRWSSSGASSCLRVLQGHSGAVLRVSWITLGTQVVSAGSDGLLKVWSALDSDCQATLDSAQSREGSAAQGEDDVDEDRNIPKIWALDSKRDGEFLVSGDSAGQICIWRDQTLQATQAELAAKQEEASLKQDMENQIKRGQYVGALSIALSLGHRAKCKQIVDLIRASGDENALSRLVGSELDETSLERLLKLCVDWNKNSTHCMAAQVVMHAVLSSRPADSKLCKMVAPICDSWLSFSERHEKRLGGLIVNSYILDQCLDMIGGDVVQHNTEEGSLKKRKK